MRADCICWRNTSGNTAGPTVLVTISALSARVSWRDHSSREPVTDHWAKPKCSICNKAQVLVHNFSWFSCRPQNELTRAGRWFSRWSPPPRVGRSGSTTAWTRVSPPCSGVFITNLISPPESVSQHTTESLRIQLVVTPSSWVYTVYSAKKSFWCLGPEGTKNWKWPPKGKIFPEPP